MFCIEDMEGCIQEWFASASSLVEVAKTYYIVAHETENQLSLMMERYTEKKEETG